MASSSAVLHILLAVMPMVAGVSGGLGAVVEASRVQAPQTLLIWFIRLLHVPVAGVVESIRSIITRRRVSIGENC